MIVVVRIASSASPQTTRCVAVCTGEVSVWYISYRLRFEERMTAFVFDENAAGSPNGASCFIHDPSVGLKEAIGANLVHV